MVEHVPRNDWIKRCNDLKSEFPFGYTPAPNGKIKTQQAIEAIYKGLKPQEEKMIVSTGVGNHQMMSCQFIRWTTPRSIVTSGSLGGLTPTNPRAGCGMSEVHLCCHLRALSLKDF